VPIVPINGSPASNRTDLMSILLKYPGQALSGTDCGTPCSELLRLDLRVPPTAPENQSRLGAALFDRCGWPNGRRPNDDVTDIAIRVVGGTNYITNSAGDGVNFLVGAPGTIGTDITVTGMRRTSRSCRRRMTARTGSTSIAARSPSPIRAARWCRKRIGKQHRLTARDDSRAFSPAAGMLRRFGRRIGDWRSLQWRRRHRTCPPTMRRCWSAFPAGAHRNSAS
jgi:hypothetical protein